MKITGVNIKNCIPEDKCDEDAIKRAEDLGFPGLNPILPNLLEWVQDAHWPVTNDTAALLSKAGLEIVPHIRFILSSEDGMWKYWVIELVLKNIAPEVILALKSDLARLISSPSQDDLSCGVDEAAQALLDHILL